MKITTTWKTGYAFESKNDKGAVVHVDGKGGFGPKSLLLTGLSACSGIDVVDILEKMRVPFASLEIDAEADQTTEDPKVYKDIHVTYKLRTAEENRDKVIKAIELSLNKYCGVAAMLKKNAEISYALIIDGTLL